MFPFTLHQLSILKTIAMTQSFTKAATSLYISQPAISKQIICLERSLGIQLFERQTTKVFLTKNGKVLLKYSERILALCEESCRVLTSKDKKSQEDLKIGTNELVGTYLLPKLIKLCNECCADLKVKIIIGGPENLAKQLLTQRLDVVLTNDEIEPFVNENTTIHMQYYLTDPFHLILSRVHPFARKRFIHKRDLYRLNYITLEADQVMTNFLYRLLSFNQINIHQFKNIIKLDSVKSLKTSVKLGLGVAFVPYLVIEKELELKMIKIIKIRHMKITQKLVVINSLKYSNSKNFQLFYNQLFELKKNSLNTG